MTNPLTATPEPVRLDPFPAEPVPLRPDGAGGYLVGATRVPLDTVIDTYLDGATPEDIVRSYDTLQLADVHAVIAYYWRNQERIHEYLAARKQEASAIRQENERRFPDSGHWERLRALKRQKQAQQP